MRRLREKLHGQRGASLVFALTMLLLCLLVAGTILAAAASNAGKYRSNRAEQQKYLLLSSAIQLVADELKEAKYTGKYTVHTWDVTTTVTDKDGNTISTTTERFYHCEQTEGDYSCGVKRGSEPTGEFTGLLPLLKELDGIFSKQFTGTGYSPLASTAIKTSTQIHTLTVTLSGVAPDTGPNAYKVFQEDPAGSTQGKAEVTVEVKLDQNTRHITLTAWEGTAKPGDEKTMKAELVAKITETVKKPDGTPETKLAPGVLTVGYDPAGRAPCGKDGPGVSAGTTPNGDGTSTTVAVSSNSAPGQKAAGAPMKWELHWIKKGAV